MRWADRSVRRTISTDSLIVGTNTATLAFTGAGSAVRHRSRQHMNMDSSAQVKPKSSAPYTTAENSMAHPD